MDFKTFSKTLSKSSDFKPLVFKPNITPVDVIKNQRFKKEHLVEHILEIFIVIDK